MCFHPAPLFLVINMSPFTKWWVGFMTCHPALARGHKYIIMAIEYFTKWAKTMSTFLNDGEMEAFFIFN
jgi:hypothetical protein